MTMTTAGVGDGARGVDSDALQVARVLRKMEVNSKGDGVVLVPHLAGS